MYAKVPLKIWFSQAFSFPPLVLEANISNPFPFSQGGGGGGHGVQAM